MFDLGFMEMLVIGIIGLLVLGPERLPVAVRTVGLAIGRIKRGFADVQAQVEREIGADEIRQQLHNEKIMKDLEKQERAQAQQPADEPKRPLSNVRRPTPPASPAPDSAADSRPTSDTPNPADPAPDSAAEEPLNRPHER
ncbi:Sec-independent protein translocase protein TatB [Pseudomonas sp.]|jgi:sec-independent protein translocase protein TatB|uniref:Sec-independent protein translocase protein TatB n=1 Tax=Pseudomonas sp. TaxID=306 RepID=UPI00272CF813|nr:Sec-independent protein translocase protein TatB [Pseudomonas sp.]